MIVQRIGCAGLVAVALVVAFAALELFSGPRPDVDYPDPASSPYRLPWPAGVERTCAQGNRGVVSHYEGRGEFSWDFAMPIGSPVCAARGGTVERVVQHHTARGTDRPNNLVVIRHADGSAAHYLHLRRDGSRVTVGQRVARGEVIAESGNVGKSLFPHLHFHVTGRDGTTQPISFGELPRDGVPRMLRRYRSRNTSSEDGRD